MARTCGIRIGPRRFEIVVLDGNPKKHRIAAYKTGELPAGDDDSFAAAAAVLGAAAKELKIPLDATSIAVDTGLAAFRSLKLPFSDREKIEEVIKFEVESQLPQWDIGEVVIDFIVQDQVDKETNLLVTAVPKEDLKHLLDLCSKAGIEPLEADLEATAMVNAALGADICHVDDAQVLLHIGESSTSVVVVDGGKVRSMRAIHVGAFVAPAEEKSGEKPEAAAPTEGAAPAAKEELVAPIDDPEAEQRRLINVVSRIKRELGRTISGARTVNTIGAIYVCGYELPELVGSTLMDMPVYELDVFDEDGGQPASGAATLVVAYGVALRQLGGPSLATSLRREELRFTGTLERVELPLAIAMLLLATLAGMFCMFEVMQLKGRQRDVKAWRASSENFLVGDPAKGHAGNLSQPHTDLDNYLKKYQYHEDRQDGDPERTDYEQMQYEQTLLGREIKKLESQLGTSGEILQPQSALLASTLVLGVFEEAKEKLGRFSIRILDASYVQGTSGRPDSVKVLLDLSFFGETAVEATIAYDQLEPALRAKPWVTDIEKRGSKEFDEKAPAKGVFIQQFTILCDLTKVPKT
ncbi:MAG: pilus assembly protein PilM [Planctomycetes bacterium]|nr:pilus assembly protein PilM [Planctomycetota bacterium]